MARSKCLPLLSMRNVLGLSLILFIIASSLVPSVRAWDQGDFEIFDLVDELEKSEGKDVNFYSWLEVSPSATSLEINKAYRKMSLRLHPDKNAQDPKAQERFARLGKVVAILRNSRKRERYDFFYKNGVPRWRGTGYYYSRFRPGLTTVIIFLLSLAGLLQYMVSWINYRQERRRIVQFVEDARLAMAQRVPKSQGAPTLGRSYVEIGGRVMRCEVKSDTYILVYPNEGEEPVHLNLDWVPRPTLVNNVYFISWPRRLFRKMFGSDKVVTDKESGSDNEEGENGDNTTQETTIEKKKKTKRIENVTGSKVGGRRRAIKKN